MAQEKFVIALSGVGMQHQLWQMLDKQLRKFFPPFAYEIRQPPPWGEHRDASELRYHRAKEAGTFSFTLPDEFRHLELQALASLDSDWTIDCALAVMTDNARWSLGKGVQSHFEARALLIDAPNRKANEDALGHLYPSISVFGMHHLGPNGTTNAQIERGYKTVMKGAIEGWRFNSRRYDGILKRMNLHTEG